MNELRLAFVVVVYKEYSDLRECLSSFRGEDLVRVIVVDNTPRDAVDEALLRELRGEIEFDCIHAANVGYFGGLRLAFESYPELRDCDYVTLMNADAIVDFPSFRSGLPALEGSENIGAVAPLQLSRDGGSVPQMHYLEAPSSRDYSRLAKIFSLYPLAIAHRVGSDIVRRFLPRQGFAADPHSSIFAPHGSVLTLSSNFFEHESALAFPCFLFCEEVFVGLKCREFGLRVVWAPEVRFAHAKHGSMGSVPSRVVISHLAESHQWAAEGLRAAGY